MEDTSVMGGDNRCTVWKKHDLYRCAMTLCKGTEENRPTGATLFADFRRQHLEMEIRLNGQNIRTGVAGAKKRSRKVKRKVLREERRRVEKRPLSRLQADNGHSGLTRCRKTSRKLSDWSYYIDLYS